MCNTIKWKQLKQAATLSTSALVYELSRLFYLSCPIRGSWNTLKL